MLVLSVLQRRAASLTPEFVLNVYHALKEVAMPGSGGELERFFAGDPLEEVESDDDERGEEGGTESEREEDEMSPPCPKRRKRMVRKKSKQERKSLGVLDIQVWTHPCMHA